MRLHGAGALRMGKAKHIAETVGRQPGQPRHRQRRTDQPGSRRPKECQRRIGGNAQNAGDLHSRDQRCQGRFGVGSPGMRRSMDRRGHYAHRMDDGGFVYRVPFKAMDLEAVHKGGSCRWQAFSAPQYRHVATCPPAARCREHAISPGRC